MLKNNKQRGTGLRLVRTQDAFQACFETTTRPGLEGLVLYRWYLAQQYITNPLLIRRRKFGVRLWALVPGVAPLRAYLHQRGLALFSSSPYQPDGESLQQTGSSNPQQQGGCKCRCAIAVQAPHQHEHACGVCRNGEAACAPVSLCTPECKPVQPT
jgi:hypothetical protein